MTAALGTVTGVADAQIHPRTFIKPSTIFLGISLESDRHDKNQIDMPCGLRTRTASAPRYSPTGHVPRRQPLEPGLAWLMRRWPCRTTDRPTAVKLTILPAQGTCTGGFRADYEPILTRIA